MQRHVIRYLTPKQPTLFSLQQLKHYKIILGINKNMLEINLYKVGKVFIHKIIFFYYRIWINNCNETLIKFVHWEQENCDYSCYRQHSAVNHKEDFIENCWLHNNGKCQTHMKQWKHLHKAHFQLKFCKILCYWRMLLIFFLYL